MQCLFVHRIIHPLFLTVKGEPKDVVSLERYQGTRSQREMPRSQTGHKQNFLPIHHEKNGFTSDQRAFYLYANILTTFWLFQSYTSIVPGMLNKRCFQLPQGRCNEGRWLGLVQAQMELAHQISLTRVRYNLLVARWPILLLHFSNIQKRFRNRSTTFILTESPY